jgi:hypothetical protein
MNLDHLDRRLTDLLRERSYDPDHPLPWQAWEVMLALSVIDPQLDDLGEDFMRVEISAPTTAHPLEVMITRELSEADGHDYGGLGFYFAVAERRIDPSLRVLVETNMPPDNLTLEQFVEQVEQTPAFRILLRSLIERSQRYLEIDNG